MFVDVVLSVSVLVIEEYFLCIMNRVRVRSIMVTGEEREREIRGGENTSPPRRLLKIQQEREREGLTQNPVREREREKDVLKIQQERERKKDLFKIQQERERKKDLFKIQQEREREREKDVLKIQ